MGPCTLPFPATCPLPGALFPVSSSHPSRLSSGQPAQFPLLKPVPSSRETLFNFLWAQVCRMGADSPWIKETESFYVYLNSSLIPLHLFVSISFILGITL